MKNTSLNIQSFLAFAGMAIVATTSLQAQAIGTLTDETYTANAADDPGSYSNASSIPVSSTDLLEGLSPISTNYVPFNSQFGPLTVLTDGTTAGTTGGDSAPSDASDAAFDLNDWYAEYELPTTASLGYILNDVVVTTGHLDFRTNQNYDILVSTDGITFTSLSDGTSTTTLGDAGSGFSYNPTFTNGGAAQTTVSPVDANLGTGIKYIEFVAQDGGNDVFREVDVFGTAVTTPEPSTIALMLTGLGMLIAIARFRRSKS
jgi:hypothetical protein